MFLGCRLGPTLSCLVAEKGKFSNQLRFSHNKKAFWPSQHEGEDVKEINVGVGGGLVSKGCIGGEGGC